MTKRLLYFIAALLLTSSLVAGAVFLPEWLTMQSDRNLWDTLHIDDEGEAGGGYKYQLTMREKLKLVASGITGWMREGELLASAVNTRLPKSGELSLAAAADVFYTEMENLQRRGLIGQKASVRDGTLNASFTLLMDAANPAINMAVWLIRYQASDGMSNIQCGLDAESGKILSLVFESMRPSEDPGLSSAKELLDVWLAYAGLIDAQQVGAAIYQDEGNYHNAIGSLYEGEVYVEIMQDYMRGKMSAFLIRYIEKDILDKYGFSLEAASPVIAADNLISTVSVKDG